MATQLGLGKVSRKRLSQVLRGTAGTVTVEQAATILKMPPDRTAKLLSRWAAQGWMSRVRRGLYIPVPLEASSADFVPEDPWIIASRLYSPCYIGGWSAAEYWGLTEQLFRTLLVMVTRRPAKRKFSIKGTTLVLRTIHPRLLEFGMKTVWRGQARVQVSDPTRTTLDIINDPTTGGGLRPTVDIFRNYLRSEHRNTELLGAYAAQLGNGAVFKRLGFLVERLAPEETALISACKTGLTAGNAKIDPARPADKLITRWKLWVPANWATRDL